MSQPAVAAPSRASDLDVLPGFRRPPPGYGEVSFYWWVGDPLSRERLTWQLDRLAGHHISGLQINYAHSDKGGRAWGLTYPSEPPLFSDAWWELFGWFLGEAKSRGMSVSLSDYTLGVGQGSSIDAGLAAYPQIQARVLKHERRPLKQGESLRWPLPPSGFLSAVAVSGEIATDLSARVRDNHLEYTASADGEFVAVWHEDRGPSIDPTHPDSGRAVIEHFFEPFTRRFPNEAGAGLNFFFSDELEFCLGNHHVWSDRLAETFRRLKGYDLAPHVAALFADIGPITPKLRLDHSDVFVRLSEEYYFKPVYDWHEARGMIYGCDHGGRGHNPVEFGDYFRTQRWNQGPGCDQPHLGRDLIKNKVAASIAHLYQRPRVWLEGFYSSGWGTSSAQVWNAIAANFLQGHNLLTLHGLYYTTHGGWWEWAPPCNHFRMPYWAHMKHMLAASERLSYLLSQGVHVCDVAVLYPVAAMEADRGPDGRNAVKASFDVARGLYAAGRDLDFMDFESLDRAEIRDRKLHVAGESFSVLVIPAMRAIRHSTLIRATEFARAGGCVVLITPLPDASDHAGRSDSEVARLVGELSRAAVVVPDVAAAVNEITRSARADIEVIGGKPPTDFLHRRVSNREVFGVLGVAAGSTVKFATTGVPELWNPWTGETRPATVVSQSATDTTVRLDGDARELQLLVFSPGTPTIGVTPSREPTVIAIDGDWTCELVPTLDNTWGDYHWPPTKAMIGAEAREFRYAAANGAASAVPAELANAPTVRAGYGPKFLKRQPSREPLSSADEDRLARSLTPPRDGWSEYVFSWERGLPDDAGHQGYHGLKEETHVEFLRLGKLVDAHPSTRREPHPDGDVTYLWTTVYVPAPTEAVLHVGGELTPAAAWVNGVRTSPGPVKLVAGANVVLLRYDRHGAGYAVLLEAGARVPEQTTTVGTLRSPWADCAGLLPFDVRPGDGSPAGWYEFTAPPGARAMIVPCAAGVRAWCGGAELSGNVIGAETRFTFGKSLESGGAVVLHVSHDRSVYGGDAIAGPVRFECGAGRMPLGDWSHLNGLRFYSGGMRYSREVQVPASALAGSPRVTLDLGEVIASAEVRVNGQPVGVRLAPPWTFDMTGHLRAGVNSVEVLVYSALAGHYRTIPTRYPGSEQRSGLIGPVRVLVS